MLCRTAALLAILTASVAVGQAPTDPVTRRLTAQTALAQAKRSMATDHPAEASLALEAALPCAEGDPAFLALLRNAYSRELAQGPSASRAELLTSRLQLLTGAGLPAPAETPPTEPKTDAADSLRHATQLFQQGGADPAKLAEAAKFFAGAFQKVEMSQEQLAAWAFCRIRVANDRASQGADVTEIRAEIEDARKLAPESGPVRERADAVLASLAASRPAVTAGSANFQVVGVVHPVAAKLADAAEQHRKAIHTYWAGQAPRDWSTKCELVLHATAAELQRATRSAGTGSATVTLDGQTVVRKLHLAADDAALLEDSLPRELTHLVLADLFPRQAPPHWAAVGMAAIATSAAEQGRYLRTLDRLAAAGSTLPAAGVIGAKSPTAANVTAFHVESLAMVQYLANLKGGPAFVEFLSQAERYGVAGALEKLYGVRDVAMLEGTWRK